MENEGGRGVVEGGALCERKNARGVDPNRNWEVHWGFREKDYDPNEEYPGARPFRCCFTVCWQTMSTSWKAAVPSEVARAVN